ncbi:MAG: hypothetical protein AAF214_06935 [Pseudomonadota bacterium]
MSNNKILTVSYGTFSCTLEGFDDSFGTMKAIAEYFRDLASDDRYFGAEPPQPDAEMLTRIAEREISRRVEAREHQGRIVLSAHDADPEADPAENAALDAPQETATAVPSVAAPALIVPDAPATSVADVEIAPDAAAEDATPEHLIADETEAHVNTPAEEAAETDDITPEVVEDVQDDDMILDVVSAHTDAPLTVEDQDDAHSDPVIDADMSDATEAEAEAFFAETDSDTGTGTDGDDDMFEDAIEDAAKDDAEQIAAQVVEPAPVAAPDSIAAKLQRIRAVVSKSQEEAADDDMFEDEHAEDVTSIADRSDITDSDATPQSVMDEAAKEIEDSQNAQDADDAATDDDDDIAAILARFDTPSETESPAAVVQDVPEDVQKATTDEDENLGLDSLAALMAEDEASDDSHADGTGENLFDDADAAADTGEQDEAQPDTNDAEATPRRARIIKVKRADIDAAVASGQIEEVNDDAEDAPESSLSLEDEAELMAELGEVEAELAQSTNDGADEVQDTAAEVVAEAQAKEQEVKDDDVSRLMAEADNQMEEPEGSRRRNAFAHLKAAVMAKKADDGIGKTDEEDEGAFRSDLASVVKPRRPAARGKGAERPETNRPAPLKLVAEQRVDVEAAPKGPVRPRRVAAIEDAAPAPEDAGSFADYATDMGAHNLPELLEAAASYLSFVEGRDQFSRPQLMTKVRQVEQGDFSREDGLRSFGQLLRAGKIEKIKGGRFAVTGDIGYRPDERAAG